MNWNLDDAWNYILGTIDLVGLIALRAVGQKKAVGWVWAMFTQAVWIIYSIATLQWGFLIPAIIKFGIYTWNYVSWVRSDKAAAKPKTHEERALAWVDELIPDANELVRLQAASFFVKAIRVVEVYPQKGGLVDGFHSELPSRRVVQPRSRARSAD